jgi:mono/diheme cytochrome c family protein
MIERLADGSWRFATYVWNADGTAAEVAPEDGLRALAVSAAPNGRYAVPSRDDCLACHGGPAVPVLGFSALQLAPELRELVARGLVKNLPASLLASPPRIAAATPTARAALGYLHGNCGHCHNDAGAVAGVDLVFAQQASDVDASAGKTLRSVFGRTSRFSAAGSAATTRDSVIVQRMRSTSPYTRMPPLGVHVVDREGVALVERWIQESTEENTP